MSSQTKKAYSSSYGITAKSVPMLNSMTLKPTVIQIGGSEAFETWENYLKTPSQ